MAGNLGSLTVSLGLDAADYTRGLTKAERDAYKFGEAIGTGIRNTAIAATTALAALGVSAAGALAAFNGLVEGASKFADLADKTGASAEALASFAVAAGTSGVSMDKIASAANTLTKNLVGVNDESKAAGAALKALGIPIKDFKALKPEEQIEKLASTLGGFEDGASKTAVAMALFGKAGADVLPFLKTLEEQGGRQKILTQEQIDLYDEYGDRQAKAKAELSLYAQALGSQAIPMITAFTGALTDTIKEMLGVDDVTKQLKNSNDVAEFAETAVRFLGFVIDTGQVVVRTFEGIGFSIYSLGAAAANAATGDFKVAMSYLDGIDQKNKEIANRGFFSDKLDKRIAEAKKGAAAVAPATVRPTVNYSGAAPRAKSNNSAAQEAKAQLASDLDDIRRAQDAIVGQYRNAERVLAAERSAGLKDESAYYAEKVRLMGLTTSAQEDALRKTIERLQQEKLTGKDAIDNARKIADAQAKLQAAQADAATSAKVAAIEHEAALRRISAALLAARQAAQDYFDTTNLGYERQLAGIGQGNKFRDYMAGIQQIEDRYQQQRMQLANQRAQSELAGTFGASAQREYEDRLSIINEFQTKAVDSYRSTYEAIDKAQSDWLVGASEALRNYADEAANVAAQMEETVGNALRGLEDEFTNLFTGKGFNAKKLIEDLQSDLTRGFVKQNITGPLAGWLGDTFGFDAGSMSGAKLGTQQNPMYVKMTDQMGAMLGGIGGGKSGGGWLSSLVGVAGSLFGGFSTGTAASLANSLPGDSLDNLFKLTGNFGRASGGIVRAGGMYRVNENGPELLDVNGKQLLMMGGGSGRVTSNAKLPSGGGFSQSITYVVEGNIDRRTQNQLAAKVRRDTSMSARLA